MFDFTSDTFYLYLYCKTFFPHCAAHAKTLAFTPRDFFPDSMLFAANQHHWLPSLELEERFILHLCDGAVAIGHGSKYGIHAGTHRLISSDKWSDGWTQKVLPLRPVVTDLILFIIPVEIPRFRITVFRKK